MQITELISKIFLKQKQGLKVSDSDFPTEITLQRDTFNHFRALERYTAAEGLMFEKKQGVLGWEYAITIVQLGTQLYYGTPAKGDYSSVFPTQKVSAKALSYSKDKKKVSFELAIGDYSLKTPYYKVEEVNGKNFVFTIALVVHTHPKFHHKDGTIQYTFFSVPDLEFLAQSQFPIIGLITHNTIWLACKNSNFSFIDANLLSQVTLLEKSEGEDSMKDFISKNFKQSGLIFYYGKFGDKLRRV